MTSPSRFGAYFRKMRMDSNRGLRAFCAENGFDAGNISKLERGRVQIPGRDPLIRYAQALGIEEGSAVWVEFLDLAAAEAGRIPEDILSDEELAGKLPLVFRTLRGEPISEDTLKALAERIRRA